MSYGQFINFIRFCNDDIDNASDANIAYIIWSNINDIHDLTIENISEQANVSPATIRRFIKKAGFDSFQTFKDNIDYNHRELKMRRLVSHSKKYLHPSVESIIKKVYEDAIHHLQQTKQLTDFEQLKQMIEIFKNSKTVIFIGDMHELRTFYPLQIDLLVNGIPAYLVNFQDIDQIKQKQLNEDCTLVMIDVFNQWHVSIKKNLLDLLSTTKVKSIIISQEKYDIDGVTINYLYGVSESNKLGYYSLPYLNRILTELMYLL